MNLKIHANILDYSYQVNNLLLENAEMSSSLYESDN